MVIIIIFCTLLTNGTWVNPEYSETKNRGRKTHLDQNLNTMLTFLKRSLKEKYFETVTSPNYHYEHNY